MNMTASPIPSDRQTPCKAIALTLLGLILCAALTACSGYRIEGKVVAGLTSAVVVVDHNDPRLEQPGIEGATIDVTLDPESMAPKRIGADVSDMQGNFGLPVNEPGAGLLEYEMALSVQAKGHKDLWWTMQLPGSKKRLLIIIEAGSGGYRPPPDIIDETIEAGERLTPR